MHSQLLIWGSFYSHDFIIVSLQAEVENFTSLLNESEAKCSKLAKDLTAVHAQLQDAQVPVTFSIE